MQGGSRIQEDIEDIDLKICQPGAGGGGVTARGDKQPRRRQAQARRWTRRSVPTLSTQSGGKRHEW